MSRFPIMEYTSFYAPFQMNFAMFTVTSGFVIAYILLMTVATQLCQCCCKNRNRYVARHSDPIDRRLQR